VLGDVGHAPTVTAHDAEDDFVVWAGGGAKGTRAAEGDEAEASDGSAFQKIAACGRILHGVMKREAKDGGKETCLRFHRGGRWSAAFTPLHARKGRERRTPDEPIIRFVR